MLDRTQQLPSSVIQALSIDPRDLLATDLLDQALEEQVETSYSSLSDKLKSMGIQEEEPPKKQQQTRASLSMVMERGDGGNESQQSQSQDMSISRDVGDSTHSTAGGTEEDNSEMMVEQSM